MRGGALNIWSWRQTCHYIAGDQYKNLYNCENLNPI